MRKYRIEYTETYEGVFEVELDDASTMDDAIRELTENPDQYHVADEVELSDSNATVTGILRPFIDLHELSHVDRVRVWTDVDGVFDATVAVEPASGVTMLVTGRLAIPVIDKDGTIHDKGIREIAEIIR